ncbi:glutamate ABC transporter substrate-binding protein [Nocardia yunnanensis]|uniref:Glutamate ABC transporter substrate-binding protein n=1 Tax=Nocardia yunnanensis TaxID=2382165 RepID=A0A386Z8B5_9NOCA|nr:glutamate ABC transporter substrate-binding protein [Nocardia yunnanensis]
MNRVILAAAIAAGLMLATACGTETASKPTSNQSQALTIGVKYDQPGLSVKGPDDVQPKGFDADTARYVAGKLGVNPERITWKEARSDQREHMLADGAVDFVVASYSITADRLKDVSFAGPYLVAGQDLLVRKDDTAINRQEDLDGRTVCTAQGSTSAQKIQKDFAQDVQLTTQQTYSACVDQLRTGEVDAVTTDDVILAGYAAQYPDQLRVVGHPFTRERYGIGVKKGNTDLQAKVTQAIRDMISDGSWQRSVDANLAPSGYHPMPPPPVFNAPDKTVAAGDPATLDPELVRTVDGLADTANKQNIDYTGTMVHRDGQWKLCDLRADFVES